MYFDCLFSFTLSFTNRLILKFMTEFLLKNQTIMNAIVRSKVSIETRQRLELRTQSSKVFLFDCNLAVNSL